MTTTCAAPVASTIGANCVADNAATASRRLLHTLPFAIVALAGQLSSLLDPTDMLYFWLAALGLAATAAVLVLPQRHRSLIVAATLYVASVADLMIANGGVSKSGLGVLFILAVVYVALQGERRDSIVVVLLVLAFFLVVTLSAPHTAATTTRRLVFLGAIAAVVSWSIHALRDRLEAANRRTTHLLRQSEAMSAAARELAVLREPRSIAAVSTELAARLASMAGGDASEAWYVRPLGNTFEVVAHCGEVLTESEPDLLPSTTLIAVAARTRDPISRNLQRVPDGMALRGAWIPVGLGNEVHGVLKVVMTDTQDSDGCIEQLTALGHLMQMALGNWAAHEEFKRQATSEERRRVARDLHDGLAHELAFIASKARRRGAPPEVKELSGAADRALDEARRAITVLSAGAPQSLVTALTQTAEDLGARLAVHVLVDLDDGVRVDPEVAEQLLRIVREGLTNAAVHGKPQYVMLSLRGEGDRYRLVVADDGCGFDPQDVDTKRFGLVSMRERVASIGGAFSVDSAPGRGTRLEVMFG